MRRQLNSLFGGLFATDPKGRLVPPVPQCLEDAHRFSRAGDIAQAIHALRTVLDRQPDNPQANFLLGRLCGQRGQYDAAVQLLENALRLQPDHAAAWNSLANVFRLQGRIEEAVQGYRHAIAIEPGATAAYTNLARALLDLDRDEEALTALDALLQFEPHAPEAYFLRGTALRRLGKQGAAIAAFAQALDANPRHAAALENLTDSLLASQQFEQALRVAEDAVRGDPRSAVAHGCRGSVLLKMDRLEAALASLEHSLKLDPDAPVMLQNKGIAMQYLGRLEEARASFDRAVALRPDYPYARYYRSLVHLLAGDYARGWQDYEYRPDVRRPRRSFPYPRWDGSPLEGRSLLVYAEQGLGDEIMFASCLPELMADGGRFVVDCSPKLSALFARSFPEAVIHAGSQTAPTGWLTDFEPIDVCIPVGSLPLHFRRSREAFPRHDGYLKANPDGVAKWRSRLAALGAGMKIGISWRGGTEKTHSRRRSIDLVQWLPLLVQRGVHFISLQYTDCRDELEALEATHGVKVHHWQEAIDDYDQTAALTAALDMVISVQTAIVHLCGALNTPVWALVSASPEWRYGWSGSSIPWYPSLRLFRQRRLGDWEDVMSEILDELGWLRSGG